MNGGGFSDGKFSVNGKASSYAFTVKLIKGNLKPSLLSVRDMHSLNFMTIGWPFNMP